MVLTELLRLQAQTQAQTLTFCVQALARDPLETEHLDACASAARLFEGTAQVIGLRSGATLARTMEECLLAVRSGEIELQQDLIGLMLECVGVLDCMASLPDEPPSPEESADSQAHSSAGTATRVLIVDDAPDVLELERHLLSFGGYEVVTASDGKAAWFALCNEKFDAVLTDVEMPMLDGIRLIRLIRQDPRLQNLPILVVCDNTQQCWSGFDAGADYYVSKSSLRETLSATVATLIARRGRDSGPGSGRESASN